MRYEAGLRMPGIVTNGTLSIHEQSGESAPGFKLLFMLSVAGDVTSEY